MGLILIDKNTSFGERVKIYRSDKNMTQIQLARESGISRYLIRKIEKDDYRPGFDKMMILASVLEMPVEHVFKGNRFVHVMGNFYAGKTAFGKFGPQEYYGKVHMKSCMNFDEDELFCITKEDRTYMASFKIIKNSPGYVCVNRKTGICDIFKNPGRRNVIGSVISDVTDLVTPIMI